MQLQSRLETNQLAFQFCSPVDGFFVFFVFFSDLASMFSRRLKAIGNLPGGRTNGFFERIASCGRSI